MSSLLKCGCAVEIQSGFPARGFRTFTEVTVAHLVILVHLLTNSEDSLRHCATTSKSFVGLWTSKSALTHHIFLNRRVIETWFDKEYREFFYTREPFARYVDMGDISEQLALKERMNCKSFDWFMKEVAYDVFDKYPKLPPNKLWGELKNEAAGICLDTHGRHPPEKVSWK